MFGFYGGKLKRFMIFIQNKIDKLNLNLGTSLWKASTNLIRLWKLLKNYQSLIFYVLVDKERFTRCEFANEK